VSWMHVDPPSDDPEQQLIGFTELIALAIGNAHARHNLIASRARLVTASDETRRRIERNLHDGVQQRLVALGLRLRAVRAHAQTTPHVEADLSQAMKDLEEVIE